VVSVDEPRREPNTLWVSMDMLVTPGTRKSKSGTGYLYDEIKYEIELKEG
jgi:hypothetical protein